MFSIRHRQTVTSCAVAAVFMCSPVTVTAEVYRWVDANGNVHFSDQAEPGAQQIDIPPTTTISLPKSGPESIAAPAAETQEARYSSLAIEFPAPNSAFHSGNGSFTVVTDVQPGLSSAHELQLLFNGQVYATGQSGEFVMNNVDRGTHTLQLQVIDDGKVIQSGPETQFTIHRPSLLNPNRAKNPVAP